MEVIRTEVQVGTHGEVVQVVEVIQSIHVVLQDGRVERGGEELDWVVGGRGGKVDGGRGR